MSCLQEQARAACANVGVEYKEVAADGRWYTADIENDPKGKGDGRLKLFIDGRGGLVCNHKTGALESFFIGSERTLTAQEREDIERCRQKTIEVKLNRQNRAAAKAQAMLKHARQSLAMEDHPYLIAKRIQPPQGLKIGTWRRRVKNDQGNWYDSPKKNCLFVPMINEAGKIRGLQIILPKAAQGESNKAFLSGAETKGLFFWVGAKTETVCVCEGMATAASVHEATGRRCYIAFSAGNLAAVGRIIREKLPNAQIVFCGDNDKSGTGQAAATEAALLVDGLVSIPPEIGDWNDFINQGGTL